jgi:hypothetical protein
MSSLWQTSQATTETIFDLSGYALLLGGAILVVGLLGEIKTEGANHVWYKRFAWSVALGVCIELFADGGVFFSSRRLQTISDAELALANQQIVALAPRRWLLGGSAAN